MPTITTISDERLADLPTEAQAALAKGESFIIECHIDDMFWTPGYDADIDHWSQGYVGVDVKIASRDHAKPVQACDVQFGIVKCDSDGNWDTLDGETVGDITYTEIIRRVAAQARDAARNYAEACRKSGTDPLDQFSIARTRPVVRRWAVTLRNTIGNLRHGAICIGARANGRGEQVAPLDLPVEVREFLELRQHGGNRNIQRCPAVKSLDPTEVERLPGVERAREEREGGIVVEVCVTQQVPVGETTYAHQVRLAARRMLADAA